MDRVIDIINRKRPVFSFEIYPPKTDKGVDSLFKVMAELSQLNPDYVSVTYGAGGSTSKTTFNLVKGFTERFGLNCMHHLTLVNSTVDELREKILAAAAIGCRNMLALRGDPPKEQGGKFSPVAGGLKYSYELVELIRETVPDMGIAVSGYPEKHVDSATLDADVDFLSQKLAHGAQAVVTQLFFEPATYFAYVERLRARGITAPVLPGILPITNYENVVNFCARCGAGVPESVHQAFRPVANDPEETLRRGIDWAVRQGCELLRGGAPGLHFYCLNKTEPLATIWPRVRQELGMS